VTIADEPNMKTIAKAEVPGLTKAQNSIQIGVLIAVSIITVWTLYMVPSWQVPGDPFPLAAVVGALTVACLWLARWLGSRAMKFEPNHARRISCGHASRLYDGLVRGTRPRSEFVDLGRASGISALCCFRCTRSKELALVLCYRNRRPGSGVARRNLHASCGWRRDSVRYSL